MMALTQQTQTKKQERGKSISKSKGSNLGIVTEYVIFSFDVKIQICNNLSNI